MELYAGKICQDFALQQGKLIDPFARVKLKNSTGEPPMT